MFPDLLKDGSLIEGCGLGDSLYIPHPTNFRKKGFTRYSAQAGQYVAYNPLDKSISKGFIFSQTPWINLGFFDIKHYEKSSLDEVINQGFLDWKTYEELYNDLREKQDYPQAVWDSLQEPIDNNLGFYIVNDRGHQAIKVKSPTHGTKRTKRILFGKFNPVPEY